MRLNRTRANGSRTETWRGVKLASNDPEGAVGEYQAALQLAPIEAQLVADATGVFEKQGRIDAAIEGYEALYKQGNPQAQQFAATILRCCW